MKKINLKITILALIALGFAVLSFTINWLFIIPAVIIYLINQKELYKKKIKKN